jgi:hypothetical protein
MLASEKLFPQRLIEARKTAQHCVIVGLVASASCASLNARIGSAGFGTPSTNRVAIQLPRWEESKASMMTHRARRSPPTMALQLTPTIRAQSIHGTLRRQPAPLKPRA